MNKVNLQRMIDHIKTLDQSVFSMKTYRTTDNDNLPKCKSVGCIIGHCTILDHDNVLNNFIVSYDLVSIDFLGWSEYFTGIKQSDPLWDYMFASKWSKIDNTIAGAIKRIQNVINGTIE